VWMMFFYDVYIVYMMLTLLKIYKIIVNTDKPLLWESRKSSNFLRYSFFYIYFKIIFIYYLYKFEKNLIFKTCFISLEFFSLFLLFISFSLFPFLFSFPSFSFFFFCLVHSYFFLFFLSISIFTFNLSSFSKLNYITMKLKT